MDKTFDCAVIYNGEYYPAGTIVPVEGKQPQEEQEKEPKQQETKRTRK